MTWHLKDREFEKKLNEKSPPILNFTTALNVRMARIPSEALKNTLSVFVEFQRVGTAGVIHEHNVIEFSVNEIEEVIESKSHMFARRIGSKGHLIQLSTAYTNGGIGIHPQEMFYESFLRDYGQTAYWRVFVKP